LPIERRDPVSQARLFIPTVQERKFMTSQKKVEQTLQELEIMKAELQAILDSHKDKN
jgi:hypothetical protein